MIQTDAHAPLHAEIRRLIRLAGPMPVNRYMDICLTHPDHGYYVTRDPLGRGGDFVTAPEVSQMFGEMLGLWAASVWKQMGSPSTLRLIELGPGRGTMMMDALRATRIVPEFLEAAQVDLVEINPALRDKQRATLAKSNVPVAWYDRINDVPPGPCIVLANEFFDALPVRQAIKIEGQWFERCIAIGEREHLVYTVGAEPIPRFEHLLPQALRDAANGAIFEWRNDEAAMALASHVRDNGGAALIIDYGHFRSDIGDTFQAIAHHAFADPLITPGEADLTAHVDFEALANAAEDMRVRVHGPVEQGEFLIHLGIENRALSLMAKAQHEAAENVASGLRRLTSRERDGMGALFKVMGLSATSLASLPALPARRDLADEKIAAGLRARTMPQSARQDS